MRLASLLPSRAGTGRAAYVYVLIIAAACVGILGLIILGYTNATALPVVRQLVFTVPDYSTKAAPLRIVLFSDLHVHGPDMPPERVARIVDLINALHADVDIAAGDFTGDTWIGRKYSIHEAIAPLAGLKATYGIYAVLGNNDYQVGAHEVTQELANAGIRVLINAVTIAGPLAIGGIDGKIYADPKAWTARRNWTYAELARTRGIKVLVAHRPDEFAAAPQSVTVVLAGHTHCGQIVLPLVGAIFTGSDYGRKYACGVFRDGSKVLVVTAGLGTSHIPLRIGAPADIWLITIESSRTRTSR